MFDVLSFVDVPLALLGGGKQRDSASRQIAVNGVRLDNLAGGTTSTLLVAGVDRVVQLGYLESLRGGPDVLCLSDGRLSLGVREGCLGNDGWVLAASLELRTDSVRWLRVGFDTENGFPRAREGPWWKRRVVAAPPDWQWWTEQVREQELSFSFSRSLYEATITAELERLKESE